MTLPQDQLLAPASVPDPSQELARVLEAQGAAQETVSGLPEASWLSVQPTGQPGELQLDVRSGQSRHILLGNRETVARVVSRCLEGNLLWKSAQQLQQKAQGGEHPVAPLFTDYSRALPEAHVQRLQHWLQELDLLCSLDDHAGAALTIVPTSLSDTPPRYDLTLLLPGCTVTLPNASTALFLLDELPA